MEGCLTDGAERKYWTVLQYVLQQTAGREISAVVPKVREDLYHKVVIGCHVASHSLTDRVLATIG